MARTRLTIDVDPELRRRIRIAVASRDETIKDFLERAILRELGDLDDLELGAEQAYYSPEGPKAAEMYEGTPKLRSERTVAEAVIEDQR
jgi:hypothetical protein